MKTIMPIAIKTTKNNIQKIRKDSFESLPELDDNGITKDVRQETKGLEIIDNPNHDTASNKKWQSVHSDIGRYSRSDRQEKVTISPHNLIWYKSKNYLIVHTVESSTKKLNALTRSSGVNKK